MLWTCELDLELIRLHEVEGLSYGGVACVLSAGGLRVNRNQALGRHQRILAARKRGLELPTTRNRQPSRVAHVPLETDPTGFEVRVTGHHPTLTGRLMGDPPPGRTPWA